MSEKLNEVTSPRARPFIRFVAGLLAMAGVFNLALMVGGSDSKIVAEQWRPWVGVLTLAVTAAMAHVAVTGRWPWRLPDERRQ